MEQPRRRGEWRAFVALQISLERSVTFFAAASKVPFSASAMPVTWAYTA